VSIVRELLESLTVLDCADAVHADVKPENVLL
jgi:serine/threonine protein kinase